MQWDDEGIVLGAKKHGESSVIAEVFAKSHGRHKGLVRGGTGARTRGTLQPGNSVRAIWSARLAEHLGTYQVELSHPYAAEVMTSKVKLAALASVCALASATLPEREPHDDIYAATVLLFDLLADEATGEREGASTVVRWELGLLAGLGFGLDLSSCAVTGVTQGLTHVSPRTGRAVSREGAGDYAERLLTLPAFLTAPLSGAADIPPGDLAAGFALTGHFIERHMLYPVNQTLPPARERFIDALGRIHTTSSSA